MTIDGKQHDTCFKDKDYYCLSNIILIVYELMFKKDVDQVNVLPTVNEKKDGNSELIYNKKHKRKGMY